MEREKAQREVQLEDKVDKPLYGAIAWAGLSIGTIVMVLTLPRHESQNVHQDDNNAQVKSELQILSSERREFLIDEKNGRSLVESEPGGYQKQVESEPEFKSKNRFLENSQLSSTEVLDIVENNRQVFSKQDVADINMYYPIYKAVGDRYDIDWYLLWIMHQEESTVSRNPHAFDGSNGYAGAMQRNPYFYPEEIVDGASEGLEYLAELPQRYPTDWREIAFAGWKISRDKNYAQNAGAGEPLLSALFAYSAQGPALSRWEKFNYFSNIFNES